MSSLLKMDQGAYSGKGERFARLPEYQITGKAEEEKKPKKYYFDLTIMQNRAAENPNEHNVLHISCLRPREHNNYTEKPATSVCFTRQKRLILLTN